jgi:anti-sigma factor RsiW
MLQRERREGGVPNPSPPSGKELEARLRAAPASSAPPALVLASSAPPARRSATGLAWGRFVVAGVKAREETVVRAEERDWEAAGREAAWRRGGEEEAA